MTPKFEFCSRNRSRSTGAEREHLVTLSLDMCRSKRFGRSRSTYVDRGFLASKRERERARERERERDRERERARDRERDRERERERGGRGGRESGD